jgi:hypothetical protein
MIHGFTRGFCGVRIAQSVVWNVASSASFLDLYLEFDDSGQISTKIYDTEIRTILSKESKNS